MTLLTNPFVILTLMLSIVLSSAVTYMLVSPKEDCSILQEERAAFEKHIAPTGKGDPNFINENDINFRNGFHR